MMLKSLKNSSVSQSYAARGGYGAGTLHQGRLNEKQVQKSSPAAHHGLTGRPDRRIHGLRGPARLLQGL